MKKNMALLFLGVGLSLMAFGREIPDVATTSITDFSELKPEATFSVDAPVLIFDYSAAEISHELTVVEPLTCFMGYSALFSNQKINDSFTTINLPEFPDIGSLSRNLDVNYKEDICKINPDPMLRKSPGWNIQLSYCKK